MITMIAILLMTMMIVINDVLLQGFNTYQWVMPKESETPFHEWHQHLRTGPNSSELGRRGPLEKKTTKTHRV